MNGEFTTRVELHDATWQDYEDLHAQMRRQGFSTTIRADNGATYHLPPAEYNFEGQATSEQVRERASTAASAVKRSYAVLVSEATARAWVGLQQTR